MLENDNVRTGYSKQSQVFGRFFVQSLSSLFPLPIGAGWSRTVYDFVVVVDTVIH